MTEYQIKTTKEDFYLTAYGVGTGTNYSDYEKIKQTVADFKAELEVSGKLEALRKLAADSSNFVANDGGSLHGQPYRYYGVAGQIEAEGAEVLKFPAGDYLVIFGDGQAETLAEELLGRAFFGGLIQSLTDYEYRGPNNAIKLTATDEGKAQGELWLPVHKK